jgi:hypothetical protein
MFSAQRYRRLLPVLAIAAAALTQACSDAATPKATSPIETPSAAALAVVASGAVPTSECATPGAGWIFCDDFETNRLAKYYEIDNASGRFARTASSGRNGSFGMRAAFAAGQASGGRLSLAFGKVPSTYFRPVDAGTANYRELYWRFFVRRESGWVGNGPGALTKAMIFAGSNWSQAMVAYGRTDASDSRYLQLEPMSGTDASGKLVTAAFNDTRLRSLGAIRSAAPEEDASRIGQWACYELHAKLNDVGQANGVYELSVNGQLSARKAGMNWTGAYATYGINSLNIENFYPNVAPAANVRTMDNLVVSTAPIGCGGAPTVPPTPVVATVSVAIDSTSLTTPHQAQATATLRDSTGTPLAGTVTWTSSNTSVASVSSAGVVTSVGAGSANIIATSGTKSGQASISVVAAPVPVASVSVALAASSVAVGGTTTETATLRDMSGNVLTNRPVTWTSSNTAIATVSSTGAVTGVAAGSANIVGTSGGVSGQASLVVTSPPPPSGGTLLFNEDFENTNMTGRGWYDLYTTPLLSTDHAVATSTRSLQLNYAPGAMNPGISGRHLFTPSTSVYLSYWVKYSTNWVGSGLSYHPHEFHFLTTEDNQWIGPAATHLTMYVESNFQNGVGAAVLSFQDALNVDAARVGQNLTSITENRAIAGCNGNADGLSDGCYQEGSTWLNGKSLRSSTLFTNTAGSAGHKNNWHRVEVFFQLNSIVNGKGQLDGIAQYWFDGQLIIDKRNLIYRTAARPNMKFNQFMLAPYIGNGSPLAQSMWIDDVVVRTAR